MHNCSKTKEQILELLLDGADRPRDLLSKELHACRECTAEFDSLSATLRITNRLKDVAAPSEIYWTSYHARLRQKLLNVAPHEHPRPSPLIAFFKSSIRVPVPVAAAAVIACLVLVSVSLRKSEATVAQAPSVVHVPVNVPVVQEKIVTKIVYKQRRQQSKNPTRINSNPAAENTFAKSQKPDPSLSGFKPAEDVKLVVIKGGSANEK